MKLKQHYLSRTYKKLTRTTSTESILIIKAILSLIVAARFGYAFKKLINIEIGGV